MRSSAPGDLRHHALVSSCSFTHLTPPAPLTHSFKTTSFMASAQPIWRKATDLSGNTWVLLVHEFVQAIALLSQGKGPRNALVGSGRCLVLGRQGRS
ncbi:hypothetical protein C0Q70_09880 [Pomacea canaliculata]|uniref:Uncharacterized protein n=1 Tax=Pomacea canaliculata TaxID=400727 RepID=A0A2T7PB17_POMCA|nr:hypothetical protein C0Q70_09880 [Pomacea canaliculata]